MKRVNLGDVAAQMGWDAKVVASRLRFLGYVETCGRCCGTGEYSYNQIHGTMCYGCNGKRTVIARITPAILADIQRRVAAGELQPYLDRCAAIAEARRQLKPLKAEIDDAWRNGAIHTAYNAMQRLDAAVIVASDTFKAVTEINALWERSNNVAGQATDGRIAADVAVAELRQILADIKACNEKHG